MRTLYKNARIISPAAPRANAMVTDNGQIAWLGARDDAPAADRTVDCAGDLITPGYVDAHVHTTGTGSGLLGLELSDCRDATELLDRVAAAARDLPPDATVLGRGWDDSSWVVVGLPTAAQLTRAAGGRRVYLSRVDGHSALCSSALVGAVDHLPGYDEGGWLRRDANLAARKIAYHEVSAAQRGIWQRAALDCAAREGIVAVHECASPTTSSEDDLVELLRLAASEPVPAVYGYWGELGAVSKARELGAVGAGGDLSVDGSIGSGTAWLHEPYVDHDGTGFGYLSADDVAKHVMECVRLRMPAGFHSIGDQATTTVLAGFRLAAEHVGRDVIRVGRHRLEHVQLLTSSLITEILEFGLVASVQPAFEARWGGADGMYAQRLGATRALSALPLRTLSTVGVPLAFGSDAPVTEFDPWGAVLAAGQHHNPASRLGVTAAFAAHTRGGWRAVGLDDEGVLVPGGPATFAQWSWSGRLIDGLPNLETGTRPSCRRTVLRGETLYAA